MSAADSALVCVGPTGVGYYVVADRLPQKNSGEYAIGGGALLICDAAIVASEVAATQKVYLVTNGLGHSSESTRVRDHLIDRGVKVKEDPEGVKGVPFDSIWVERSTGSRAFVTTGFCPKRRHIRDALTNIYEAADKGSRNIYLYMDIELGSPPALEVLECFAEESFSSTLILANVGDVVDLPGMFDWLADRDFAGPTIFQASTSVSDPKDPSALSGWDGRRNVILTIGGKGALFLSDGSAHWVDCDEVDGALTVGAGAILSASVLKTMISQGISNPTRSVVEAAVTEASLFVRTFSAGTQRQSICLW